MAANETKIIASGKHVRLVSRDGWEYVERHNVTGIVGIVAVTPENKLILVEQHRTPVGKNVIELPAGLAGDIPGGETEALATAARRELLEETGYEAAEMLHISDGAVSAGITNEIVSLFEARGLKRTTQGGGDGSENIRVHEIPVAEVPGWLRARQKDGLLVDWKIHAGLYFLLARGSN
jgi:ADP-ribose pyrophosphatase